MALVVHWLHQAVKTGLSGLLYSDRIPQGKNKVMGSTVDTCEGLSRYLLVSHESIHPSRYPSICSHQALPLHDVTRQRAAGIHVCTFVGSGGPYQQWICGHLVFLCV